MQLEPAELESLLAWVVESGGSVDLDQLVRRAAMVALERGAAVRSYAPGATYAVGERIRYQGRTGEVVAVRPRGNPVQGSFSVLELRILDAQEGEGGVVLCAVAEAHGAPVISATPENSGEALVGFLNARGGELRAYLSRDPRFGGLVSIPTGEVVLSAPRGRDAVAPVRASTLFRADAFPPEGTRAPTASAGSIPMAASASGFQVSEGPPLSDVRLRAAYETARSAFAGASKGLAAGQTWCELVAPAITSLGWAYAPLPEGGAFALFPDVDSRDRARSRVQQGFPLLEHALAVLVVEDWGRPLGRDANPDDFAASGRSGSPALRLVGHLLSDGVVWGILTNGREWRLYSLAWGDPDVGSTFGTFHAVDLSDIVGTAVGTGGSAEVPSDPKWQRFRTWAAVFGPGASNPDAYGHSVIDGLKRESSAYARGVVRDLRKRLLESVLPEIAGGFVMYRVSERGCRNAFGAGTETDETLEEIVRASLGLVYRLLFVLHSEQHAVLPMHNPDYRGQSLTTLVRWARDCVQDGPLPSAATHVTPKYNHLLALFRYLDHGHPLLGLAEGGGEVFSPTNPEVSFLERHRLSDRVVARTLAALGTADGEPVDYSVICTRHLSAVGEGLLESLLWVVESAAGQVVLVSNSGIPQAPSSVPVPDFVGVSVIEQAIKTALASRVRHFSAGMDEIAILRRGEAELVRTAEPVGTGARAAIAAAEREACDALLGIKVLDPAMGTGTLLVGAIDTLVDGIAEALAAYHRAHPWVPWAWNPVTRKIAETREAILVGAEAQGLVVRPESLEDDVILSRLVAERAIYGVDLNQTAVTLGRTSVTMRAHAVGAPFIDVVRHIRRGDSLLGARLADVRDEVLAPSLVAGLLAADVTREDARDYAPIGCVIPDTAPSEALLDVWFSEGLGNPGAQALLMRLGDGALPALRGAVALSAADVATLDRARELAAALGFLHWDVAFPEVFLEQIDGGAGQPGFDVIIGSPPVVSLAPASGRGEGDPFLAQARRLVRRPGGRVAFVMTPAVGAGQNRTAWQG